MDKICIYAIIMGFGLLPIAPAAEEAAHTLSEWKLGSTLFGEDVSEKDMEGKVVVIEHWGVNCPPCIALLPHLAKMDKRHRDDGLLIIGAESQNSPKDQIEALVKKTRSNTLSLQGQTARSISTAFLTPSFSTSGKI